MCHFFSFQKLFNLNPNDGFFILPVSLFFQTLDCRKLSKNFWTAILIDQIIDNRYPEFFSDKNATCSLFLIANYATVLVLDLCIRVMAFVAHVSDVVHGPLVFFFWWPCFSASRVLVDTSNISTQYIISAAIFSEFAIFKNIICI